MNSYTPFELHLKPLWLGLVYLLLLIITILSLIPTTDSTNLGNSDKLAHFLAYAALSTGFSLVIQQRRSLWWVFFGLNGYGLLLEYLQGLTGYRTADINDAIANSIGVVAGLFAHFSPLRGFLQRIDFRLYRLR